MLEVKIARGVDDPNFVSLFNSAFPPQEKIPLANLRRTLSRGGVLRFFYESHEFVGFCYTFDVNDVTFLVYLATRPDFRGLGYGSEILDYMGSEKKNRKMFLVVEKIDGNEFEMKLKRRRQDFYRRNGWKLTGMEILSDGYYFDSMYLDRCISEQEMVAAVKYYEEVHTGAR